MIPSSKKIGRNDPCPCGSGKKHKHCCLKIQPASSDGPWRRQRDASDRVTEELLRFSRREFSEGIHEAWLDFNQMAFPKPMKDDEAERQIFSPYFLFEWDPDRPISQRGSKPRVGLIVRSYLLRAGSRLSELERLVLDQATSQPVSFYEVVRCDPGERLVLRDILIGGETEVEEHSGSRTLQPGDLTYAQIWFFPEVATLGRMAPVRIPPGRKVEIVGLRAKLRRKIAKQGRELAAADLIRYAEEIRATYLNIRDAMRAPPRFCNTDGDPLGFHTLTFRIGSAQVAFDALAPLAWGFSREELLDDAELDGDGALQRVAFDWIKKGNKKFKTWENTIMGHLKISGRSLVAEVNSANRAAKIRQEIEQRLGILATHQSTVAQTPEELVKKVGRRKLAGSSASEAESDDLLLDPELRREAEAMMQSQVENWIHQKIPVLGGRTPLEAVGDPDGREMVEGLLLEWERRDEGSGPRTLRPDVSSIRRLLSLALPSFDRG